MDEDVRRELDRLYQADRDLRTTIESLDTHGSRGVIQLVVQVTQLIKDMADVRLAFSAHEVQHREDEKARQFERAKAKTEKRNRRYWLIGTVIALAALMVSIIVMLIDILSHVHAHG